MKKVYLGLMTVSLAFNATAQTPKGMGASDPKAKMILDAVSAKLKTYKNIESKFSLKIKNGAGKILATKVGSFYLKGAKYRISAPGQEVFSDGSNAWTFDKKSNEVTISKIDPSSNTITPQKLFTNFYDKDFLYKLNGTTKNVSEIELTPIDKTKPIYKMYLYITNNAITSAKFLEKNNNVYTLSITSVNSNAVLADPLFIFDTKKYPGVEVVDIR